MKLKNFLRRDFTQVPNELINDESISRDARFLFVWLCAKPDNWEFYNEGVNRGMGCKDDSRRVYMKELHGKGWLSVFQKRNPDGSWAANDIILNPYPIFTVSEKTPHGEKPASEKDGAGKNPAHNNTKDLNNTKEEITNTETLPLFQSDVMPLSIPEEVLKYLNEKKGGARGFDLKTANNQSKIRTRIKEKFTIEDFKKVIDYKVAEWGKDKKNRRFLRPETLFGEHFNGYLIAAEENPIPTLSLAGSQSFVNSTANDDDLA